jgi:hypothetical protein
MCNACNLVVTVRYLLSDLVIRDLRQSRVPHVPPCEYYMLTNGDNLYSSNLLPAALPYMRKRTDLIAFEFLSRYNQKNPSMVDHPGRKDQVRIVLSVIILLQSSCCICYCDL